MRVLLCLFLHLGPSLAMQPGLQGTGAKVRMTGKGNDWITGVIVVLIVALAVVLPAIGGIMKTRDIITAFIRDELNKKAIENFGKNLASMGPAAIHEPTIVVKKETEEIFLGDDTLGSSLLPGQPVPKAYDPFSFDPSIPILIDEITNPIYREWKETCETVVDLQFEDREEPQTQ